MHPQSSRNLFWQSVDKTSSPFGCWLWTDHLNDTGYGMFYALGKRFRAHIYAWQELRGPIPDGLSLCHSCDTYYSIGDIFYRRCVNPDHLWIGTHLDNMHDASVKSRIAQGERHWRAKLDEATVLAIRELRYSQPDLCYEDIGAQFGISRHMASLICRGKNWTHVGGPVAPNSPTPNAILTEDTVREIRNRRACGESVSSLVRTFGVKRQAIGNVLHGRAWGTVL